MESKRGKASFHSPNWGSLPQELQTSILVRLPVKYLLRFKSVSKYSLRLISNPQFVKAHLHVSSKDYRFLLWVPREFKVNHCSITPLFNDRFTNLFYLDHPLDNPYTYSRIVGSVNGLICFENGSGFVLWNPSTRKFKKVPEPTKPCGFLYGFGYDEVYDDYKLVGVGVDTIPHSTLLCAKIYSLRSDSWRELDFQGRVARCESAKLVNGKLHWATGSFVSDDWGIISFDLVDEKFGEVVQPSYEEGPKNLYLEVLGSDLSMLCYYMRSANEVTRSDVWVMKEYGVKESWTKLYTIKYPGTYPGTYPDNRMQFVNSPPICMSSKGAGLFFNGTTLSIYNPDDKTFTEVTEVNGHLQAELYVHSHIQAALYLQAELYIESLVCPILQNEPMQQH